jgi:hypothetical protein
VKFALRFGGDRNNHSHVCPVDRGERDEYADDEDDNEELD